MAAALEFSTEDKLEYHFRFNNSNFQQFRVRAPNDVHISLTISAAESDPMYEIFLGGSSNQKSVIRKNRTQPEVAVADTPGILSADEFRGFWVRWEDGTISAGREGESAPLLTFTDDETVPINYFGFCTGLGASGRWIIEVNDPYPMSTEFTTEDNFEYHFRQNKSGFQKFRVRSPNDAHIALTSSAAESDPMYEIFLGGSSNQKSVIRKNRTQPDVAEADTPGILNGVEYRDFWVRWENRTISAGRKGESAPLLTFTDKEYVPINYFGVSSGFGARGRWIIEVNDPYPMSTEFSTEDKLEYQFRSNNSSFQQFRVRAPNDAHIALTSSAAESDPMYEIFLGGSSNQKSVIRKNRTQPEVAVADTPGILNADELRGFWVRWENRTISAGREGESAPLLTFTDKEYVPINYFGVCTGLGASGHWIIEVNNTYPLSTEFTTEDKLAYYYRRNKSGFQKFRVRAPKDAHIALTSSAAKSDPMYEIFLGGWGNQKSVIRKNRIVPEMAEADTPGILSADEFRGFWVRWENRTISAGREGESAPLLTFTDKEYVPINYFGVCTAWGASGRWIIEPCSCPACGDLRWVAASNGSVPGNAFRGGEDKGEPMYIIRARYKGGLIPGKLLPSRGQAYIPWDDTENACSQYEVLCDFKGTWTTCSGSNIPSNALPAGQSENGEQLFIGRVNHEGCLTVGSVQASRGVLCIPYGGKQLDFKDYEILVQ